MERICVYRKVSDDGRVICRKVVEGDAEVSPSLCRGCPARACNCENLKFSLQKSAPSPIVVRYGNGRTQVWDDEPPTLSFLRAACAARVMPITHPKQCAACALRPATQLQAQPRQATRRSKVIAFPTPVAATG